MHTVCNMVRRSLLVAALALAVSPAAASAAPQTLKFKYGPVKVTPGQNEIKLRALQSQLPPGPGYITRFKPNLVYKNGQAPPVDVIHLHHGVWLVDGNPTFAVGEEKTEVKLPAGYGWRYDKTQAWFLNDMLHNLTPTEEEVYVTWEFDFVPDTDPAAAAMKTVRTQWMDVAGLQAYPVFDVHKGSGTNGKVRYPDQVPGAPRMPAQSWDVQRPGSIIGTAAHLHPGGLFGELWLERGGKKIRLFKSVAKYYEPAGAVSWDVSMTTTPPSWKVALLPGDRVSVTGTYDTRKASWYESMAIMPLAYAPGDTSGVDPFTTNVDVAGVLTHGHLKENDNHGNEEIGLPDARQMLNGRAANGNRVPIAGFLYRRGDLSLTGQFGRPPTVKRGKTLTFVNQDAQATIYHTITACKAPCNKSTGIAYPLANGPVQFDSGELGFGPRGFTAAKNTDKWQTPSNLSKGTYNYFCRVHPFMRGAFRVV